MDMLDILAQEMAAIKKEFMDQAATGRNIVWLKGRKSTIVNLARAFEIPMRDIHARSEEVFQDRWGWPTELDIWQRKLEQALPDDGFLGEKLE